MSWCVSAALNCAIEWTIPFCVHINPFSVLRRAPTYIMSSQSTTTVITVPVSVTVTHNPFILCHRVIADICACARIHSSVCFFSFCLFICFVCLCMSRCVLDARAAARRRLVLGHRACGQQERCGCVGQGPGYSLACARCTASAPPSLICTCRGTNFNTCPNQ